MKYKIGRRVYAIGEVWREDLIVDESELDAVLRKILLEDGDGIFEVEEIQSPTPTAKTEADE